VSKHISSIFSILTIVSSIDASDLIFI
jgi:hypothetical protein